MEKVTGTKEIFGQKMYEVTKTAGDLTTTKYVSPQELIKNPDIKR